MEKQDETKALDAPPKRQASTLLRELGFRVKRRLIRTVEGATPRDAMWERIVRYRSIHGYLDGAGAESLTALEVSGDNFAGRTWRSYEHWDYPDFDLCATYEGDAEFDVVLCDQVLEHVVDPVAALRTLHDLCRSGGTVIVGTPFLVRIHASPKDYWRFTPDGLRLLLERVGLDPMLVQAWGNRRCVRANFYTWSRKTWWRSSHNEPLFPITVWAIARRPHAEKDHPRHQ